MDTSQADMGKRIRDTCTTVAETLCRKNADYGNSGARVPTLAPWLTPVEGLLCRQSDKYARIGQLIRGNESQVDESLLDTALDQVGYAVLIYLAIENQVRSAASHDRTRQVYTTMDPSFPQPSIPS